MCFLINIDPPWQVYTSASKMDSKPHLGFCWSDDSRLGLLMLLFHFIGAPGQEESSAQTTMRSRKNFWVSFQLDTRRGSVERCLVWLSYLSFISTVGISPALSSFQIKSTPTMTYFIVPYMEQLLIQLTGT